MSAIDAERRKSRQRQRCHVVRSRARLLPRELSDEEYASVRARRPPPRASTPGEVIFSRGELGRSMFMVESGQIQLEFGDGMPDKLIGAREFFGELALFIGNHARVANAVAVAAEPPGSSSSTQAFDVSSSTSRAARAVHAPLVLVSRRERAAADPEPEAPQRRSDGDAGFTAPDADAALDRAAPRADRRADRPLQPARPLHVSRASRRAAAAGHRAGTFSSSISTASSRSTITAAISSATRCCARSPKKCQNAASPCDLPCRLGGDEFALLMQVTGLEELSRARDADHRRGAHAQVPGLRRRSAVASRSASAAAFASEAPIGPSGTAMPTARFTKRKASAATATASSRERERPSLPPDAMPTCPSRIR